VSKIDETAGILEALGLPKAQKNERSALTLLALMDLREDTPWSESKQRTMRIHDIIVFVRLKGYILAHFQVFASLRDILTTLHGRRRYGSRVIPTM
jgi:hypothetical protein